MKFPGFLGNEEVKAALSTAFALRRFPHAAAFLGETGCGKRTFARLVAQALVCRNRDRAPCGECPSCIRAAAGSHPDIRVVEGSGNTHSLTVDTVKEVIADAYRMPEEGEVSVYILLLGARTADAAQNKLLKIIEEPPEGAVFFLVCETAEQLLPTIRSRVQSFVLRPPQPEEAAGWLAERKGVPLEEARRLAALCGGNLGRMQEELAGSDAAKSLEIASAMATGMLHLDGDSLLKAAAPLQADKKLCREALLRLGMIFRDACVAQSGGTSSLSGAPEAVKALERLPRKRLTLLPGIAEEFLQALDRNANVSLLVTCLCARLREAAGR